MLRACDFNEISDGHTYGANDMVKADTGGCAGCHKCCTGMGESIVLDPFDIWRIRRYAYDAPKSFEELLSIGCVELRMADGLILPNLRMNERDGCPFLDEDGRCAIHAARPSVCRLFPLGRVYDGEDFSYFLQKGECPKEPKTKIKVRKWIDTAHLKSHEAFVRAWHGFARRTGEIMLALRSRGTGEQMNEIAMYVLNTFYVQNDAGDDEEAVYEALTGQIRQAEETIKRYTSNTNTHKEGNRCLE